MLRKGTIGLLLGVGLSIVLSGCEFGNKDVTELAGYDTISGYYTSHPQTITFSAQIGTGAPRTLVGTTSEIPDYLQLVMSNPTLLYFDNPQTGAGSIRANSDTTTGIPTMIQDKIGKFAASSSASGSYLDCRITRKVVNFGTFANNPTSSVVAGFTVRGHLALDYEVTYTFAGDPTDCQSMLATMQSCYESNIACSTNLSSFFYQPFIQEVFDPFIKVGLMTASEIGSASSVSYHGVYF